MKKIYLSLLVVLVFGLSGLAQEEGGEHHDGHHLHKHHLSGFGGFTTNYKGKQGYKLGIEYEYRLSELVGLGGTFDFTGADFNIFAFSVGAAFHPFKFPLIPAVGIGFKNYDKENWKPFGRLMLAYEFHLGRMSLGPALMYDLFPKNKNIMTFGVTVGVGLD